MKAQNQITDFTKLGRAGYDALYSDMLAALKPVEEKYGIKFSPGGARHSEGVSDLIVTETGVASREAEDFKRNAKALGLTPEHLGSKVTLQGVEFTISGVNIGRKQNICLTRVSDGKPYKTECRAVLKSLGITPGPEAWMVQG